MQCLYKVERELKWPRLHNYFLAELGLQLPYVALKLGLSLLGLLLCIVLVSVYILEIFPEEKSIEKSVIKIENFFLESPLTV